MDTELKTAGDEIPTKVKSGRKPNAEKDLEVKKKDLRCRVTASDFEVIKKHFKGTNSAFLYKAVTTYIQQKEAEIARTTFSAIQHKLYNRLNTTKIDDLTLELIKEVMEEKDRQLLLAKMNQKLRWDKPVYQL